jgi:hypothetical protein
VTSRVSAPTAIAAAKCATVAVFQYGCARELGDWNWYLPRWLEWLLCLEHEPQPAESERAPEAVSVPVQA